jgi:hypothetical protein
MSRVPFALFVDARRFAHVPAEASSSADVGLGAGAESSSQQVRELDLHPVTQASLG